MRHNIRIYKYHFNSTPGLSNPAFCRQILVAFLIFFTCRYNLPPSPPKQKFLGRYARCSINEDKQDINRQIRGLKTTGADEVIFEYEHGDVKVKKNRYMLLEMAEAGDTIITMEVSQLSRSTQQLCEILDIVKHKHLRPVIVGSITVDCRKGKIDPMSQAFIQMSSVFAEQELSMICNRVLSGMENAKGKKVGRLQTTKENIPPIFYKHYPAFVAGTLNISEFARLCGLSRPTIYKYRRLCSLSIGHSVRSEFR